MNESKKMARELMPLLEGLTEERKKSFEVVLSQALNLCYREGKIDGQSEELKSLEAILTKTAPQKTPAQVLS